MLDVVDNEPPVVDQVTVTPAPTLFPFASLMVATKLLVEFPSATMLVGVATRDVTFAVAVSGIKVTLAVAEPATAEAVTVAVPVTVPFSVTVAWPLALVVLVTVDRVPSDVDQDTGIPAPMVLPLASLTVATRVLTAEPSATMLVGVATNDVTAAVPLSAVRFTDAVADPATAEAVTVADPVTVPFNVTVACPLALVVLDAADKLPNVVDQVTVIPAPKALP
nr:hypothetical protein [Pseudomonas corrugata]